MPLIPAFIFDMDGTLVDNMPVHARVWAEYLTALGIDLDEARFHAQAGGKTNPDILRLFVDPNLDDAQAAAMGEAKEALYRRRAHGQLQPVQGVEVFLGQAQALGVPLALATSADRANVDFILAELGLADSFAVEVIGTDVPRGKPFPDLFLAAAASLGVPPSHCLVFEDSLAGLEAAHRAGMRSVALATVLPAADLARQPGVLRVAADFTELDAADMTRAMAERAADSRPAALPPT